MVKYVTLGLYFTTLLFHANMVKGEYVISGIYLYLAKQTLIESPDNIGIVLPHAGWWWNTKHMVKWGPWPHHIKRGKRKGGLIKINILWKITIPKKKKSMKNQLHQHLLAIWSKELDKRIENKHLAGMMI